MPEKINMLNSTSLIMKKFILLFSIIVLPLNFFYALFFVLGYFPAIPLMGYSTIIHIFSVLVLICLLLNFNKFLKIKYFYVLVFFLIQVVVSAIVGFYFSDYSFNYEVLSQSIILFYYLLIYSCLGFYLNYYKLVGSKIWLFFLYLFLLTVICLYFKTGDFSFYFELMNPNVVTINYQEVSSIFLFVWFFYYVGVNDGAERFKSILIAFLILLSSGARSEFFGFIITLLYVVLLSNLRLNLSKIKSIIILLVIVTALVVCFGDFLINIFENSRHFSVIKLDDDSSWQEREVLKQKNLQNIYQNPIFGNYASHFEIGRGSYIHNILSSWQQFGLSGFILYALLILIPFITLSIYKVKHDTKEIDGFLFISTYCLTLIFVTKSVYWVYLGFSIGSFLYFCYKYKKGILR